MRTWFTKQITVPENNRTKVVDAIQLWEVRWTSRNGYYHSDRRPEMEAFPTEEEANFFADALKKAFSLIRNTSSENRVTVTRAR